MTTWQESDRKRSKGPWIVLKIAGPVIVALTATLLVTLGRRNDASAGLLLARTSEFRIRHDSMHVRSAAFDSCPPALA